MPTRTIRGLTAREAARRLSRYGYNEVGERHHRSPMFDFLIRFRNPLTFILLAAAIISGFLGDGASAVIIVLIVCASVVIDFVNTQKAQHAAEALRRRVMITATIIRDGLKAEHPLRDIVPGDSVALSPGDVIPADGKLVDATNTFVDESSLTGESFPAAKAAGADVWMGCSVVTGTAIMEVSATGQSTKFSQLAQILSERPVATEFDREISSFSVLVMKATFALVIAIFFVNTLLKQSVLESLLFAAALAVGLTPELLPMIIALNLSKGSLRMSHKGVIIKKLSSMQTFGNMNVLCTDKTGTLTEGAIVMEGAVGVDGKPLSIALQWASINSCFQSDDHNPIDAAILALQKCSKKGIKKIGEIPFDYQRKRNTVVVKTAQGHMLVTKGAPESIFPLCHRTRGRNRLAHETYRTLSGGGLRVLAVAIKHIEHSKKFYTPDDEANLTLVGFITFLDPPKKAAGDALAKLQAHGVEVKILTGDNAFITQKVAEEIHLPVKGMLRGDEIAKLSDHVLLLKLPATTLFVRLLPDQKQRIIRLLRRSKNVVGYIGDGINDAPALRAADVGISVNNAIDVAKESADIILLHKSLEVLMDGLVEGRKTFANTLKYILMALSSNFGNMISMAAASVVLPFLPMLPVQILLNNLLYDTSQFAIPFDRVDEEAIARPRTLQIGFLKRFMVVFGLTSSFFDGITFFLLYAVFQLSPAGFQTGWFIESLLTQTLVIYIIRTRKLGLVQSRPSRALVISGIGIIAVGVGMAQSIIGASFHFVPLPPLILGVILGIVVVYLLVVEFVKRILYQFIFRPYRS